MPVTMHKTKIRQLVSRQVISVTPETSAAEAVAVMSRSRISCLVVAKGRKPVGIFTERDVVRFANQGTAFAAEPICTLMTSPVVTISGSMSIFEAYSLMLTNRIRHHVVVDQAGRILGVMSQSDLINHLGIEYFIELRRIEQVLTVGVVTVTPDLSVRAALECMAGPGISCVVVAEQGRPIGILTERDAVRLVAEGVDLTALPVAEAMSSPVQTVAVGSSVHTAAMVMRQQRIRRVVAVDEEGRIAGIITQSDIVKGLEGKYIESLKAIIREKEDILRVTARELLDKTAYLDTILSSSIDMAIVAMDGDFRIKYFNPEAERVFGCSAAYTVGRPVSELHTLEEFNPAGLQRARETIRKQGRHLFSAEIERNGLRRCFDARMSGILDHDKRLVGFVLMLHDVTEQRQYERTIHHLAYHDPLTGLPNRVLLSDRLHQSLVAALRHQTRGALMILDLDRFKDINDTLGHSTGDLLLKAVSGRLANLLRKSDTVSRMGGDEFVLLLPAIASAEGATVIAGKIVRALRKPFACEGRVLTVTASIGIAVFPDDGDDAETLLKNADIALYRAKGEGRNNSQRYTP